MGQKVNPIGFRIGTFLPWKSRWFSEDSKYKDYLLEDIEIRRTLMEKLKIAGIIQVELERLPKSLVVILTVSRPGVVIGRGGSGLEEIKKIILEVIDRFKKSKSRSASQVSDGQSGQSLKIDLRVNEVRNPEISAHLVATRIAFELERRFPHRRVVNRAMERVMQAGAEGVKIILSGRIAGADIARVEKYHLGSVPTQTLRERIDYARSTALLKRGCVGVKVYIHKKAEKD
ncbi:MAG: 30S ribosomal protein S3 [Candidatus Woesebacteria bacterium GW2011_GWB1_38_5b]|uniref:Small ribosomal subunit protein uS3 n=3 Tax=root TaxID=1 RepID=A0A0G0K4U9_9BACT|nr:30S ribosomal protein S3 [uncultured organism]KKQ73832.1 MAG: 30S ribosomal protein S3 [Candidatus Woesebacteria bacterium GW2011_GWB1_38_5b]OGM19156.1 MAG: 30S ribosomal protein S3 [Candidatus Woesebacteria bacterium RIFCSPHIGHO2_01_FULL_38_10]OGM58925.1 MAG: 30S ribosomal protein S3 [Candidatus Woesebacteria bacterium RIFCSPLOWO2_01_FULL_39_10b]